MPAPMPGPAAGEERRAGDGPGGPGPAGCPAAPGPGPSPGPGWLPGAIAGAGGAVPAGLDYQALLEGLAGAGMLSGEGEDQDAVLAPRRRPPRRAGWGCWGAGGWRRWRRSTWRRARRWPGGWRPPPRRRRPGSWMRTWP
jgi:hypothetical protein